MTPACRPRAPATLACSRRADVNLLVWPSAIAISTFVSAGLDVDKLDYLARDAHFIFPAGRQPIAPLNLQHFMAQASLVKTTTAEGTASYEVAYRLTRECTQV